MIPPAKTPITRIIVLRNPASTHAKLAQKRIARLQVRARVADFEVLQTLPAGREANKALLRGLADKLGPQTLLCIAAGDGTVNMVAETLLNDPSLPDAARQTPLLPLWGGNANDLAHMLNGHGWQASLTHILHAGKPVAVQPLQCSLTLPDRTRRTHFALCYASFGASAFAAHRLSQPGQRHHPLDTVPGGRLVKELGTVIKALFDAPQIAVQEGDQTKKLYEHIFLKGSRFAKVNGVRLRLTDQHFYHTIMRRKRARSLLFHIWELTGPLAVRRVAGDHASFTPQERLWAQVDGEVFAVPAGTKVEITLSERPVVLLSTRLG